jgi:beta-lactamase regulating signal transducer with metallopeptidase domain
LFASIETRQERTDHAHVFALATALGAGGVLAAVAAVATAIDSVHRAAADSGPVVVAGLRFTHPTLNGAAGLLLALAALGGAVVAVALKASWRQRRAYRRFIDRMDTAHSLSGHPAVLVIDDPRPQAFCAGYLRPAVYVSQRTLDLLTDAELEAVLAHERHHLRVRDPLRFACGRILGHAVFFVPGLRMLCDRYADVAELEADDAAILASAGDKEPLASALLAFDASSDPNVAGISPERVDSLLGHRTSWRLPPWLMTASLGSLSGLSALIWRASAVASAHATFNLPILSSQPCLAMLTLVPLVGCFLLILRRRQAGTRETGRTWRVAVRH